MICSNKGISRSNSNYDSKKKKKKKKKKDLKILYAFLSTIHLCTFASVIEFNILYISFDENFALTLDSIAPRSSQPRLSPPASFRHSSWPSQYGISRRRSSTAHISKYCGGGEAESDRSYHISFQVVFFLLLKSPQFFQNSSACVLDVLFCHSECLLKLHFY